jgi:hypothetical protein
VSFPTLSEKRTLWEGNHLYIYFPSLFLPKDTTHSVNKLDGERTLSREMQLKTYFNLFDFKCRMKKRDRETQTDRESCGQRKTLMPKPRRRKT